MIEKGRHVPPRPVAWAALFERVTWCVFLAGLGRARLARRWPALCEALGGFDPRRVAAWDATAVAGFLARPDVVRDERKVRDTVFNARRLLKVEREHGSVSAFLTSLEDLGVTGAASHLEATFAGLEGRTTEDLARSLGIPEQSLLLRDYDPTADAGLAGLIRL